MQRADASISPIVDTIPLVILFADDGYYGVYFARRLAESFCNLRVRRPVCQFAKARGSSEQQVDAFTQFQMIAPRSTRQKQARKMHPSRRRRVYPSAVRALIEVRAVRFIADVSFLAIHDSDASMHRISFRPHHRHNGAARPRGEWGGIAASRPMPIARTAGLGPWEQVPTHS